MKKNSVSVVIPNYNGRELLRANLPKVISASDGAEIIVVDDASSDGSVNFLREKFPEVIIEKHLVNKRFAAACNTGVETASGEIVILLNSDVVPEYGYIAHLLRHFEDETVFSVGCKEVEVADGQEFVSGRTVGRFSRGFLVHSRAEKQVTGVTFWNFGGSMAANRAKYLELDGMDELYAPAYWEDIDLGYRAMQRGWKNIFEEKAVVYHKHETTNVSVFGRRKLELMSFRNQILFVWKNIRGWQLVEHFLWLPYHLLFTTLRSKGLFLVAMLQAIWRWMSFPRGAEEIESVEE